LKKPEARSLPLFEQFPALASLPRVEIARLPTRVEHLPDLGRELGSRDFWVKRDDLTSSVYGGNKVRKLEFLLGRAIARKVDTVVTLGGIGTNHGLATAIFCRKYGLKCHLVLFPQPVTDHCRQSLKLYCSRGASLHFAPSYASLAGKVLWQIGVARLPPNAERVMFVPAGGSSPLGTLGFVNAGLELARQVRDGVLPEPEVIFCALGSGGTLGGIIVGVKLGGLRSRVVGVRVTPELVVNPGSVARLCNRTVRLMRRAGAKVGIGRFRAREILVDGRFYGGGYGNVTEDARRARELAGRYGLKLETTYTAKALAAARDYAASKSGGGPILFWNTFNSADLSAEVDSVAWWELPPEFRYAFEE